MFCSLVLLEQETCISRKSLGVFSSNREKKYQSKLLEVLRLYIVERSQQYRPIVRLCLSVIHVHRSSVTVIRLIDNSVYRRGTSSPTAVQSRALYALLRTGRLRFGDSRTLMRAS